MNGYSQKKVCSPWLVRWEDQLFKIADELVNKGYATVSFDAPGHGKSPGTNSIIVDFIASIKEINKLHGPFEGDWSLVRWNVYIECYKTRFKRKNATAVIVEVEIVQDIIEDFIVKLKLPCLRNPAARTFWEKYNSKMSDYSAYKSSWSNHNTGISGTWQPRLWSSGKSRNHIYQHLSKGELMLTDRWHRKY
jgi:hypothetical protein